jgi:hypothetical protein
MAGGTPEKSLAIAWSAAFQACVELFLLLLLLLLLFLLLLLLLVFLYRAGQNLFVSVFLDAVVHVILR